MVQIKFHGHACFELVSDKYRLLIDPWFKDNPLAVVGPDQVAADYILVSHGHYDHFGDAVPIAKRTGATIIGVAELATYCSRQGAKAHGMHIGGSHAFPFGKVQLTPAWHGSSLLDKDNLYLGNPCGFVIESEGKYIYHAGDTGLFGDMGLIGSKYALDVALLPIGDNYVMGPEDALQAVKYLQPKTVVPMHYNTFDLIRQDAGAFKKEVESNTASRCLILEPGQSIEI